MIYRRISTVPLVVRWRICCFPQAQVDRVKICRCCSQPDGGAWNTPSNFALTNVSLTQTTKLPTITLEDNPTQSVKSWDLTDSASHTRCDWRSPPLIGPPVIPGATGGLRHPPVCPSDVCLSHQVRLAESSGCCRFVDKIIKYGCLCWKNNWENFILKHIDA